MSFSSKAKNEICRINSSRKCCRLAELAALIHTSGTIQLSGCEQIKLKVSTENAFIARRVFKLLKDLYGINSEVLVRKNRRLRKNNNYMLALPQSPISRRVLEETRII